MRTFLSTLLVAGVPLLAGCGGYEPASVPADPNANKATPAAGTDTAATTDDGTAPAKDDATSPPQPPQPPAAAGQTDQPAAPDARKKAEVGTGRKGQGYGGDPVTEPIRARFRIADRIVFDNIKHDMDIFKAANGRAPKSHEEFMKEIIQAGQRELPPLYAGEKYLYDPKDEELYIVPDPIK